jgi:hypothetical protein
MRLKTMVAALAACLTLGAFAVSSAEAAWLIEGVELGAAAKEDIKWEAMGAFTLTSTLAALPVKVTAKKVECAAGVTCSIDGSNFGTDHSTETLTFTEVTFDEPEPLNCSIAGGEFTTKPLTDKVIMDPAGGLSTFDQIVPETPPILAEFEFVGAACPIGGVKAILRGSLTPEMQRTATGLVLHPLEFGAAQQTTGHGELTMNKAAANLAGEATISLSGVNKGDIFSATE